MNNIDKLFNLRMDAIKMSYQPQYIMKGDMMEKLEEIEWDDNRKKINELVEGYNEIMKRLKKLEIDDDKLQEVIDWYDRRI